MERRVIYGPLQFSAETKRIPRPLNLLIPSRKDSAGMVLGKVLTAGGAATILGAGVSAALGNYDGALEFLRAGAFVDGAGPLIAAYSRITKNEREREAAQLDEPTHLG